MTTEKTATPADAAQAEALLADLGLFGAAEAPALRAGGEPGFHSTEEPRRQLRRAALRYADAVRALNAASTASEVAEFGPFGADELTQGIRAAIIAARRRAQDLRLQPRQTCERVLSACEGLLRYRAQSRTEESQVVISAQERAIQAEIRTALLAAMTLAVMVEDSAMGTVLQQISDATLLAVESARKRSGAMGSMVRATAALTCSKDWVAPARTRARRAP